MRTETVISHFRTATAVAESLNISVSAVSQWGDIVPFMRALQIERITGGRLKVGPEDYPSQVAPPLKSRQQLPR